MRWSGGRGWRLAFFATLFVVLSALYAPALRYGFNLDDHEQLDYVRQFGPGRALDAFDHFRPVKNLVFYACDATFHDNLRGWRTAALAVFFLHLFVVARYLGRVLGSEAKALGATAAYAFLAVHSSVLVWVSAFHIILEALFLVLALLWADLGCARRSGAFLTLSVAALAGALLGYEVALVFPVLLAMQAWLLGRSFRYRGGRVYLAAVAAVVVGYLVLRFAAGGRLEGGAENLAYPPGGRAWLVLNGARYVVLHLVYVLDPWTTFGMRVPDLPAEHAIAAIAAWVGIAAAGAAALWALIRRRSRVAFGLLFFGAGLAPVCNFVPVGSGPVADYYLFLPTLGLVVTGAAIIEELAARMRRFPVRAVAGCVIGAWLVGNLWAVRAERLPAWETPLALVHHAREVQGPNFFDDFVAARLALGRRDYDDAVRLYSKALREAPYHAPSQAGYVVALINAGDLARAERSVERFSPGEGEAAQTLRLCRALLLESRGAVGAAADLYREVVSSRSPSSLEARITALVRLGRMKERWGIDPGVPYSLDRAPFDTGPLYLFPGYAE